MVYYTNRNGNDDIYLMTLNGVERALVRSDANEREPSCSPDGQTVVYASDESGSYQLYRMPLNSTQPVQLTNTTGLNFAPVFSADGSQIAFVSTRSEGGIPTIWVMNADGSNPQQVTTELGRDTSPSWGPDGRQLLFSSDQLGPWDLFMTILEEEVEGEFPILPPGFNPSNQLWPVFDAQGERIAYTAVGGSGRSADRRHLPAGLRAGSAGRCARGAGRGHRVGVGRRIPPAGIGGRAG